MTHFDFYPETLSEQVAKVGIQNCQSKPETPTFTLHLHVSCVFRNCHDAQRGIQKTATLIIYSRQACHSGYNRQLQRL